MSPATVGRERLAARARRTAPTAPARLVLALVVTCQLMIVLDATVVNVALPPIQADLGFSATGLSWVVNAYTLAFGGLLLLGGRLGDAFGRPRVFGAGVALFTVSSLVGGAAPDAAVLVAARALQGVGAAIAAPSALAILLATFAEGAPRNKALGLFAAMSAAGGAIGLLVGGALTTWLSWRWVLFINVPVGAGIMFGTARAIAESSPVPGRFDLAGALTSTLGITGLVFGFIRAGAEGWGDGAALAAFVAAALLLAAFVATERRAAQPLVALLIFAGSQAVPRFLPRFGARPLMIAGAAALTVASSWLTQISASSGYPSSIAGPLFLFGLGSGLLFMPLSAVLLSGVRIEDSGAASGAMQASQQLGAALGVAILVSVFAGAASGAAGTEVETFAAGVSEAFVAATGFAVLTLVLVVLATRAPRTAAADG